MPSALLVQLRQLHPLEVSGSKPMPFAWLVQLRQLHPLKVSGSKPMPSALLVQLRQLHPLEVSDSNPMPSALLVQLRQLHPLEVSGNPTLLRTKKGLKAPYRPTQSGATQSFQPIKIKSLPTESVYHFGLATIASASLSRQPPRTPCPYSG